MLIRSHKIYFIIVLILFCNQVVYSQSTEQLDSQVQIDILLHNIIIKYEKLKHEDSIKFALLKFKLTELKDSIVSYKSGYEASSLSDSIKREEIDSRIEELKEKSIGQPVVIGRDTLFLVFAKRGVSSPIERAASIAAKIILISDDDLFNIDSLIINESLNSTDIVYQEIIVMSVSKIDELWIGRTQLELATEYLEIIKTHIIKRVEEQSLSKQLIRLGYVLGLIIVLIILVVITNKLHKKVRSAVVMDEGWYKKLSINNYSIISKEIFNRVVLLFFGIAKWALLAIIVYFFLAISFELFPLTRHLAHNLLGLVLIPLKKFGIAFWDYAPNLLVILVIYFFFRLVIKGLKILFNDLKNEKLKIPGFYPDFATPSFNIIRILLFIFMIVLVYPYLPGSDSNIFKGASVFVGILFSIGSSSALSNIVAGFILTYMRSFRINDRIKIGDLSGDVIEKSLLNIRLKTPKNEEITIPNSTVLSSNTINFTTNSIDKGLILYTTITLGYDVDWKKAYSTLIESALKTNLVLKDPSPYVLQTSLDDFYVSYQLNIYTNHANKKLRVLSELHENIQDLCNENGIEILSPHYEAARDGSQLAVPKKYISVDHKEPPFNAEGTKKD